MKILLLVDDDATVRRAMRRLLSSLDVEIREAINGLNALELIRSGLAPAVILSDVDMPALNGLEFVEKRNAEFAHIPVILCSGGSYQMQASALGVEYYEKGSDLQTLLDLVKNLLGA